MLAPASRARLMSATISSTVMGTCGVSDFIGTIPVMAALMISLSNMDTVSPNHKVDHGSL